MPVATSLKQSSRSIRGRLELAPNGWMSLFDTLEASALAAYAMASSPMVSVLMPCLNPGRFLDEAIASVLAQPELQQLIVADGGSDLATQQRLKAWENRDARVLWWSKPDEGPADALNHALASAQSEFIGWLNADDRYEPGSLGRAVAAFQHCPSWQMVYGHGQHIDADGRLLGLYPSRPPEAGLQGFQDGCYICQPTVVLRRDFLSRLGGWDAGWHTCFDLDLWLRAFVAAPASIGFIADLQASTRLHPDTITAQQQWRSCLEHAALLYESCGYVEETWLDKSASELRKTFSVTAWADQQGSIKKILKNVRLCAAIQERLQAQASLCVSAKSEDVLPWALEAILKNRPDLQACNFHKSDCEEQFVQWILLHGLIEYPALRAGPAKENPVLKWLARPASGEIVPRITKAIWNTNAKHRRRWSLPTETRDYHLWLKNRWPVLPYSSYLSYTDIFAPCESRATIATSSLKENLQKFTDNLRVYRVSRPSKIVRERFLVRKYYEESEHYLKLKSWSSALSSLLACKELLDHLPVRQSRQIHQKISLCISALLDADQGRNDSISFIDEKAPLVSICIPVYDNYELTIACLAAVSSNTPRSIPFEVILLDDCSSDSRSFGYGSISGLKVFRQPKRQGFLLNCNSALLIARGAYLLFLNNDVMVQDGWLEPMVETLNRQSKIGIVGAQVFYPDGRLQESGSTVWRDATTTRVGDSFGTPLKSSMMVRDVDYCSAAVLLVRASLWNKLSGFDESFQPAYYEDVDLCFRAREEGFRVVVSPARVIHFDGSSYNDNLKSTRSLLQAKNRIVFEQKWHQILKREHFSPGSHYFLAAERAQARTMILVVDHAIPDPEADAGSRSILHAIRSLVEAGVLVKFLSLGMEVVSSRTSQLASIGVEVLGSDECSFDLRSWLKTHQDYLDWILMSRPQVASFVLDILDKNSTPKLAYYGHDLHYRRLQGEIRFRSHSVTPELVESTFILESRIWKSVDNIYYPAADEVDEVTAFLDRESVSASVVQLPVYGYSNDELELFVPRKPPSSYDLLFVAGYSHPPNLAAVEWLLGEVWPILSAELPSSQLVLAGSNPPEWLMNRACESIRVTGKVSDQYLTELYLKSRISVAPVLYGAGVNGKIVEAMVHGLPCVTTHAGSRGFDQDGVAVLSVAESPDSFVAQCIELIHSDARWQDQSLAAQRYAIRRFSVFSMQESLSNIINHNS